MHEVSVASAVLRTVLDAVPDQRVVSVRVRIGVLSAVVPSALRFAWDVVRLDTPLAAAELEVVEAPVVVECAPCGLTSTLAEPLPVRCPACGRREVSVVGGQDLAVDSVEVDDDAAVGARSPS